MRNGLDRGVDQSLISCELTREITGIRVVFRQGHYKSGEASDKGRVSGEFPNERKYGLK
jgi:hypothetical protein